jgi:superfamily II DNA/RNA helicase
LTGRLSGTEVTNELKKVESKWLANERLAFRKDGKSYPGWTPPDFIVATNMISVGIDVSRFNTIIMNSMPRNTAEYIQASSRVARNDKGLVLTVHHPFRARDVSHYEKFIEFHRKMYSHVEPISITPFTRKAVSRYMALFLATILRHTEDYADRSSAPDISAVDKVDLVKLIQRVVKHFEDRKKNLEEYDTTIRNLIKDADLIYIKVWINEAFEDWKNRSDEVQKDEKHLVFTEARNANIRQEQLYVDIDEYEDNTHSEKWRMPLSLRVIEPEAAIHIKPI